MKEIIDDGIVYWVGQSASDNWDILEKAKRSDGGSLWLWFHLDNLSSAYVIVCASRSELKAKGTLKQVIHRAANLCKENGKYSDIPKVGVIYTELKNVKKGSKVGQVITSKTERIIAN